jgi:hypothetical protein
MQAWWESLTALERVFAAAAIPATLLLIIQLITTLIGLGGQDGDADGPDLDGDGVPDGIDLDLDGDGIPDGIDLDGDGVPDEFYESPEETEVQHEGFNLRLFSFRGIVAFFAVYGWGALAISRSGRPWLLALVVGLILGVAAMFLVAVTMQLFVRLQSDGTVDPENAVGLAGEVYLSVPPQRQGEGKVNVVIQEKMTECAAVTDEERPIPTGEKVTVIGITREKQLIVMRRE